MSLELSIEALRNQRTGKLFIVLEHDAFPGKITVVNPGGEVLHVASVIFDMDNPVMVEPAAFAQEFSPEQLAAFQKYQSESRLQAEQRRKSNQSVSASTYASSAPAKRPRSASKAPKVPAGRGRLVEWEAERLTFYRHKIEPLRDNDEFAIHVIDRGTLRLTKAQFQRFFNNVLMSASYRSGGTFSFDEIPDQAKEFFTAK